MKTEFGVDRLSREYNADRKRNCWNLNTLLVDEKRRS